MGDVSPEPSMEDILSSIKRIIAEDGEGGQPNRVRRAPRAASTAAVPREAEGEPGVLELSEPVSEDGDEADQVAPSPNDPIVSQEALASSRGSLNALTRMVARPDGEDLPIGDGRGVEAFVADLLRPMLREWLDANLPELVEAMVAKEIARITGSR